ncbi:MAG: hypothetical protein JNG84_05905 [Archangium sp.]|nr:hypothetical protein [Archangium sp.]
MTWRISTVVLVVVLGAPAWAADEPEVPRSQEIPIPFITVHGEAALVNRPYIWSQDLGSLGTRQRTDSNMFFGAGVHGAVHLDVSRHVVPFAEGWGHFTPGGSFGGTAGVLLAARWHSRLSLSSDRVVDRSGSFVTVERTTRTWGQARYPLLFGVQVGGGVFGLVDAEVPKQGTRAAVVLPARFAPRLEVGPSLLGQHHVSALLTVNPVDGVVGMRGNIWIRVPINFVWLSFGLRYDVAFNNRETRGYDYIVAGTIGVGFATEGD